MSLSAPSSTQRYRQLNGSDTEDETYYRLSTPSLPSPTLQVEFSWDNDNVQPHNGPSNPMQIEPGHPSPRSTPMYSLFPTIHQTVPPETYGRSTQTTSTPSSQQQCKNVMKGEVLNRKSRFQLSQLEDWWIWEVFGVLGSAASLTTIMVILSRFNHKEQPNWPLMSLNSLISWLSTITKGCVLIPASRGLGQLKWVWFATKGHALTDLHTFDSASRGITGSAELLWRLKGRHFPVFGALAMILTVGIDPFVQNLVHYYPGLVEDSSQAASLAFAVNYTTFGAFEYTPNLYPIRFPVDPVLKTNVYSSLFNIGDTKVWTQPRFACGTGNCTWDPLATIAVRPQCGDISSKVKKMCLDDVVHSSDPDSGRFHCTISIDGGPSLSYTDHSRDGRRKDVMSLTTTSAGILYHNETFPIIQYLAPVGGYYVMNRTTSFVATECKLELCVRSFKARVYRTIYQEETLDYWCTPESIVNPQGSGVDSVLLKPDWGPDRGGSGNQTYMLNGRSREAMEKFIQTIFHGNATVERAGSITFSSDEPDFDTHAQRYAAEEIIRAIFYGNYTNCPTPDDRLSCNLPNVAQAISKTFRDAPFIPFDEKLGVSKSQYSLSYAGQMARGKSFIPVTFVHVRWQWLTLPLMVWVLSVVTWIGALWKTRVTKIRSWWNNPLPLLFLYRESECIEREPCNVRSTGIDISNSGFHLRSREIRARLWIEESNAGLRRL